MVELFELLVLNDLPKTEEGYSKLINKSKNHIINFFVTNSQFISKFGFEKKLEEIVKLHKKHLNEKQNNYKKEASHSNLGKSPSYINLNKNSEKNDDFFYSTFKSSFKHSNFKNFLQKEVEEDKENIFGLENNREGQSGIDYGEIIDDDEESFYEFDFE